MVSSVPYLTHYIFGKYFFLFSGGSTMLLIISVFAYIIVKKPRYDRNDFVWIIAWFIFLLSFTILITYHSFINFNEIRRLFGFIFKILFLFSSIIIIKYNYRFYLNSLFLIHLLIIFFAIIIFFINLSGINIPELIFIKNDGRLHYFQLLAGSNSFFQFGDLKVFRIAGIFDEPGALALSIIWLLTINEFTFNSRLIRTTLIIGGLFTFSLAFYISSIIFFIYRLIKVNRIQLLIKLVTIVVFFIMVLNYTETSIIKKPFNHLKSRLSMQDGSITGDNRKMSQDIKKDLIKKNIFFGVGKEKVFKSDIQIASAVGYLAVNGLYGYVFFYFPFIVLIIKHRKDINLLLLLMIGINFLQRPNIENMDSMIYLSVLYYAYRLKPAANGKY